MDERPDAARLIEAGAAEELCQAPAPGNPTLNAQIMSAPFTSLGPQ